MDVIKNLPNVKDFRIYGKFHNISKLELCNEIPTSILNHIFPNYLFSKNKIDPANLEMIKKYCIILKDQAEYEDNLKDLSDKKELQIRRLEDKIHFYYLNIHKPCKCSNKDT